MSTNLVPIDAMERMAKAIASSGLFGMKKPEEALALMIVAEAEGRHPGSVAAEYHVIQGRPALKADAMLARFQQAGGKVAWSDYTDEKVSAVFTHDAGGSVRIEWDMARAKKAGLGGKDNWAKYPRQMLRARVISEGVRTCFPAVCVGIYTPEEVGDFDNDKRPRREREVKGETIDADGVVSAESIPAQRPETATSGPGGSVDIPHTPSGSPSASEPVKTRTDTLTALCKAASVTLPDMLAKGGATHADELSSDDYDDLVVALNRKIDRLASRVQA